MTPSLQCFDVIWIDDLISCLAHGVALILSLVIGLFAMGNLGDGRAERLFVIAVIAAAIASIGGIGQNILCLVLGYEIKWAMVFLSSVGYCFLLQCVLGVFILRLVDTFRESSLRLSSIKQNTMGFLFVVLQLLWFAEFALTSRIAFFLNRDTNRALIIPYWLLSLYLLSMILFVALCIWTVCEFCHNILHTAKLFSKFTATKGLDKKQLAIIDLSSKYLSLFIISLCSTLINFFIFSLFNSLGWDSTMLFGVESVVNLLCLLFQYDFAEVYYYRYCNRMDICCRSSLTWQMDKHDEAVKARQAVMHLRSGPSGKTVDERNMARELESYIDVNDTESQTRPDSQDTEPNASRDCGTHEVTITSFVGTVALSKEMVPTFSSSEAETESSQHPDTTHTSAVEVESQMAGSDLMGSSLQMTVEPSSTSSMYASTKL